MKRLIKYRYLFFIPSILLIVASLILLFTIGFNTGIDFSAGLSEQIQIAPVGFKLSTTHDNATLFASGDSLKLTVRNKTTSNVYEISSDKYPTVLDAVNYLNTIDGISARVVNPEYKLSSFVSTSSFPLTLTNSEKSINFETSTQDVVIEEIRDALDELDGLNVQTVGSKSSGIFQIRVKVNQNDTQRESEEKIINALSKVYDRDSIVILQSDFVGPKFSSSLLSTSIKAIIIAVALILVYIWVRFRFSYAISSIIALVHDVLMMLAFILIFRLEVSSTTVAAILTIIGYSLNNTIVIFDRIRENVLLLKGKEVDLIIVDSIKESLSRTIITSLTTLFAIVPLAILSSGAIKLFAINLVWGVIVGTFSSNCIAPTLLYFFHRFDPIDKIKEKKEEKSYHIGDAYV